MGEMRVLVDKDASHACSRQNRRHEAILDRDPGLIGNKQYAGASGHVRKIKPIVAMVVMVAFFVSAMFALPIVPSSHMPEKTPTPIRTVALTPHDPIAINGNAGFTGSNSSTGITKGSGTVSDPYVIEGWEISFWTVDGISISNADVHFVIQECYVHNLGPSGMAILLDACSNCTIRNCTFSNDYIGIWLGSSSGNYLVNNTCSNCWHGIDLSALYLVGSSDNNILINNNCSSNSLGINIEYSVNITLINNTCSSNYDSGIVILLSSNNTLSDNNCNSNGYYGMYVSLSSNNTLVNNTCDSNGDFGMYLVSRSSNNTLTNNTCCLNSQDGIMLLVCSNNALNDNNCSSNGNGTFLYGSNNNTLTGNTCGSNGYNGISLWSSNNSLTNNICNSNNYVGIGLSFASKNSLINNTCNSNGDGISLNWSSSNNDMSRNLVCNNVEYGVFISSGSDNRIWNNTFVDNRGAGSVYDPAHVQAYDDGTNWWNSSGTPHGYGNYWSDWQSPDNVPPYGIVDLPYSISGSAGAKDDYPLTTKPSMPIPEFGMTPLMVMILLVVIVLAEETRRKKSRC